MAKHKQTDISQWPWLWLGLALVGLASGVLYFSQPRFQQPENFAATVTRQLNTELAIIEADLEAIATQLAEGPGPVASRLVLNTQHAYLVYHHGNLLYWSDYHFVPNYEDLAGTALYGFVRLPQGQFVVRRHRQMANAEDPQSLYDIFMLLPVQHSGNGNGTVTAGVNPLLFQAKQVQLLPNRAEGAYDMMGPGGGYLFSVRFLEGYRLSRTWQQVLLVSLQGLGLLLLGLGLVQQVSQAIASGRVGRGLFSLAAGLLLLRGIMLYAEYPFSQVNVPLFDPRVYASSWFNPTFGDLFLNLLALVLIFGFIFGHYHRSYLFKWWIQLAEPWQHPPGFVLAFFTYIVLYFPYLVVESLYHNSALNLDITTDVRFDTLKVMVLLVFVMLFAIFFMAGHVLWKLLLHRYRHQPLVLLLLLLASGVLFAGVGHNYEWNVWWPVLANLVYGVLLWWRQFPRHLIRVRYATFLYIFSAAMMVAFMGSLAIYTFQLERSIQYKERFAANLMERDVVGEFFLDQARNRIMTDPFVKERLLDPFLSKSTISHKVKRVFLSDYFEKFNINVHLFNSQGVSLSGEDAVYWTLHKEYAQPENATEFEGLYRLREIGANLSSRYLLFVPVKARTPSPVGYVVVDLQLKRVIPNTIFPELFVDRRYLQVFVNKDYSYAYFHGNELLYHKGSFDYDREWQEQQLDEPGLYEAGIMEGGRHHWGMADEHGKSLVVTSSLQPWGVLYSNFSFLFLLLVFTVLLVVLGVAAHLLLQGVSLNFAAKIQLFLNLSFFIPLLAGTITTLSLVNTSYSLEVTEEYFRRAEAISHNLLAAFNDKLDPSSTNDTQNQAIERMGRYTETTITVYSKDGRLITSSEPGMYESNENYLSRYINPQALHMVVQEGRSRVLLDESIGRLFYKTVYVGVKSYQTRELLGVVALPFFDAQYERDRQIISIVTSELNIFTLLLLLLLVVSYFVSRELTFPLRLITQKIKRTSLSEYNEPLVWNADDEIGLMVEEYNHMVVKLEESKTALARNEKESAWREMAKQVAHEIKNPLTPMKLTLQHLKRRMIMEGGEGNAKIEKPINSLLSQIDTLSDIATSFSSFAKMPIPKMEHFDLARVVHDAVRIHENREEGLLESQIPEEAMPTLGDEKLLGRIVGNLIINGFQAVPYGREPLVQVRLWQNGKRLMLEVADNGQGIEESIREKVFIPNFSTKDTGSGIGLAIAKRGIEHAGGRIWFETEVGQGTSFFIELPLVGES